MSAQSERSKPETRRHPKPRKAACGKIRAANRRTATALIGAALSLGALAAPALADGPVTGNVARAGKWIVDSEGRAVIVHGIAVMSKDAPFYPASFGAQDARFLADEGFTAVRLGFIWAGIEPKAGQYDERLLAHMVGLDDLFARYGIRTLDDFHQDAWRDGSGGDGAPSWATLGSNFEQDFQDFWDNAPGPGGVGIQTRFIEMWRHVVEEVDASAGASDIWGWDLFNEPEPGSGYPECAPFFYGCPPWEEGPLPAFYNRVIAAIRSTGDRHVMWPEDMAQNGDTPIYMPGFADPQTAYNFHYYCTITQTATSSGPQDAGCAPLDKQSFDTQLAHADSLNVPAIVSEFSCSDANDENQSMVDRMGSDFLSWMIWAYYTKDPAGCPTEGLLIDDGKPGSEANAKQPKLDAIVVPYPQAIAGTPQSYAYDRSTDTMTLTYVAKPVPGARLSRGALTQIFVPRRHYLHGYRVTTSGARVVSEPGSPWALLQARPGTSVTVTISPTSAGTTKMPLQACPTPTGRLARSSLGQLRLGMTRSAARRRLVTFAAGTRSRDVFCQFASPGIVAGYRSGRVATLLTANPSYAFGGVRTGARLTVAAMRRLRLSRTRWPGGGRWYRSVRGSTVGLVQVKRGVVTQVGITRREI